MKKPHTQSSLLAIFTLAVFSILACKLLGPATPAGLAAAVTVTAAQDATSTAAVIPTDTPQPSPTPLALSWEKQNDGSDFPRDLVTAIVFDPRDPEILYAGAFNSGVYKSTNGGESWSPVNNGLTRRGVASLAIDPDNPNVLYAGTLQTGVFKTEDGGETWKFIHGEPGNGYPDVSLVAIDPQDSRHLVMSFHGRIDESRDGGATWQKILAACPRGAFGIVFHPTDGTIFATQWDNDGPCETGIYHVDLQAGTYEKYSDISSTHLRDLAVEIGPDGSTVLYVNDWGKLTVVTENGAKSRILLDYCTTIAPNPAGGIVAFVSDHVVTVSPGGVRSIPSSKLPVGNIVSVAVSPHDPNVYLAGGPGIYVSQNRGGSWQENSQGLGSARIDLHPIRPGMQGIFAEAVWTTNDWPGTGVYTSDDSAHTWKRITQEAFGLSVSPDGNQVLRYNRYDTNLWKYVRKPGGTWEQQRMEIPAIDQDYRLFVVNPHFPDTYYISIDKQPYFYYSTNSGGQWHAAEGLAPFDWSTDITGLFFSTGQPDLVYAASAFSLARSADRGQTWTNCNWEDLWLGASVQSRLAIDPRDGEHIILATRGDGIRISADGCQTWQAANTGLGDGLVVNSIVIDPNHPDTVYAGTDGGAYISFDFGGTWQQIKDGLPEAAVIYSIVVDSASNVYAATSRGIFELKDK